MWNEKPKIKVDTLPMSRAVPSQSSDKRPESKVGWVGGIGDGGKNRVTITRQNRITGSCVGPSQHPAAEPVQRRESAYLDPEGPLPAVMIAQPPANWSTQHSARAKYRHHDPCPHQSGLPTQIGPDCCSP